MDHAGLLAPPELLKEPTSLQLGSFLISASSSSSTVTTRLGSTGSFNNAYFIDKATVAFI